MNKKIPFLCLTMGLILVSCNQVSSNTSTSNSINNISNSQNSSSNETSLVSLSTINDVTSSNVSSSTLQNDYLSVSEIIQEASKLDQNEKSTKYYYFYGTISKIDEVSVQFGNASYYISDTENNTFYIHRGKYIDGKSFTDTNQIKVDDVVYLKAIIYNYKGILETYQGECQIVSINKYPDKDSSSSSSSSSNSSSSNVTSSNTSSSTSNYVPSTSFNTSFSKDDYHGYYSSIDENMTGGMNGTLRLALTSLIRPRAYYNYSSTGSNTLSSILQEADEDPNNSDNMIYFYTQKSVKKNAASSWNREHTWPQSKSGGLYGKTGGGCDILHIRPTYSTPNSTRGNHVFGETNHSNPKTYDNVVYGYLDGDVFEPRDEVKGDCARITLYMWVCYFAERNTPITNNATSIATMVKWANEDLPSEIEKRRNEVAYNSKQQNRNPFVDHPEWVNKIFAN